MKTFSQFLEAKKMVAESEDAGNDIMKAATNIGQKNPKAIIGATAVKELPNVMKDKQAQALVKQDPKNAGKLGQVLTGVDAQEIQDNPTM